MSTGNEREIRDRLDGALGTLAPARPPVQSVIRQGKAIRMRRRASIAAGLAVIIAVAVALPGLLRDSGSRPEPAQHRYHVTVSPPPRGAPAGEIAAGTIDGKPWRVGLRVMHGEIMAGGPGLTPFPANVSPQGAPAILDEETGGGTAVMAGPVHRDVTHVTMNLPGGAVLDLRPVAWHGRRWVAVVLPQRLQVLRVTAYSRHGELRYAIPFGNSSVIGWLKPGQLGPARATYTIGSGAVSGHRWVARAYAGPWGLCLSGGNMTDCGGTRSPLGQGGWVQQQGCGGLQNAQLSIGAAALRVRSVHLHFSNGSSAIVHPVAVGGYRAFAFTIAHGLRLTGWTASGAAGQELGSGTSKGWACTSS